MIQHSKGIFVAGTDTGVGKSVVAAGLLRVLAGKGLRVIGMKPIAAGAEQTPEGLRNEDALALRAAGNVEADYVAINPYCLPTPVSPHIAARDAGVIIEIAGIARSFDQLAALSDYVVVEGSGGWLAPISDADTMADVAKALNLPVVLVVGLRLGCLNHALLTAQSIQTSGLQLAAWIGTHIDPHFIRASDNIATLEQRLSLKPAAIIPYRPDAAGLMDEVTRRLATLERESFIVSF